jgi:tripartite-type tricarboxylate transporter receptor subunit TctC
MSGQVNRGISREPQILALHPSIPTNTVSEFIAYAKANPGKIQHGIGWQRNSGAYCRGVV